MIAKSDGKSLQNGRAKMILRWRSGFVEMYRRMPINDRCSSCGFPFLTGFGSGHRSAGLTVGAGG
jgi:hypothetical protein